MKLLVVLKDKDHATINSGVVYRFKCDRLECDEEYVEESSRTFGERFKEHLTAPSPICNHSNTTSHAKIVEKSSIVGSEGQNITEIIKVSTCIRVNNPSFTNNIGKYHQPYV